MMVTRNSRMRRGCTLIELIAILILFFFVIEGARIAQHHLGGKFGWLLGGVLGFVLFFIAVFSLASWYDLWAGGIPHLPRCRNGKCVGGILSLGDYRSVKLGTQYVKVCRCGDHYERRGRRFVIVNDDGAETPYLIWRPFRGWFREESAV